MIVAINLIKYITIKMIKINNLKTSINCYKLAPSQFKPTQRGLHWHFQVYQFFAIYILYIYIYIYKIYIYIYIYIYNIYISVRTVIVEVEVVLCGSAAGAEIKSEWIQGLHDHKPPALQHLLPYFHRSHCRTFERFLAHHQMLLTNSALMITLIWFPGLDLD